MTRLLIALLLALDCCAAVLTVCRAGPPACRFTRAQDAIDAARPGDVVKLQAGETFAGFRLRAKPAGPPIVITTSRDRELPLPGTRITPAYAMGPHPVTARVQGAGTGLPTITTDNGPAPAHDYALVGLEILPDSRNPYDNVQIGPTDSSQHVTTVEGLPYRITLDRDYVHGGRLQDIRRCITPHGRNVVIENSWISDCHQRGLDSQAIESWNTPGPLKILNNYLDASTEVISFGGAAPTIPGVLMGQAEIAYNHITRPDYYLPATWRAAAWYDQGQFITPTHGNGWHYSATAQGSSGDREPAWPATAGATVTDGGIVWRAENNGVWLVKNLLESKSSDGLSVHHNLFDHNPYQSQAFALVLTVRTAQSGAWARVWHTGIENNVIRRVDGLLDLLGLDDEDRTHRPAWKADAPHGTTRYVTLRNNLLEDSGSASPYGTPGDTTPVIGFFNAIGDFTVDHNTFAFRGASFMVGDGLPGFNGRFTNNLVAPSRYGILGWTHGHQSVAGGCLFPQYWFCNDPASPAYPDNHASCPAPVMTHNVFADATVSKGPCADPHAMPEGNWSAAWDQIGFAAGGYALSPGSRFARKGTDGRDVGADVSQLPLIGGFQISPRAGQAVFSFDVTPPIQAIPCVLRVSANPGLSDTVADLDPSRFTRPDASGTGLHRVMTVGQNAPLAAGTYWYYLGCGGDARSGSFRVP